ncbi:MAG: ABC transporter substrate-binding protein [Firmicutes bacterium]|nr:ABC transporter substrate-binding protein [Bacillota bacterium]
MKKTTKLFSLLLALSLLLGLAACSSAGSSTASDVTAAPASPTPTASAAPAPTASDAAAPSPSAPAPAGTAAFTTVTPGVLTMATNAAFPPYEYYENNQVVGIDVDIANAIAQKLGLALDIQDMEFDSIITAVTSGKADIGMAGMTVTPERQQAVNFTDSYATGVQVVIVKGDSPITSVDDLFAAGANHIVGVQRNTTGDIYTTGDIADAGLGTIDRYSRGADAVMALINGKVDCVVIDNEPAKAFVAANPGLKILPTSYITEDYAGAMSKDNQPLYDAVNQALKALIADGTVQGIIDKYIKAG